MFALSMQILAGSAHAISWTEAIDNVENTAKKYFDYAVEVGGTSWAGTMYNGYKFQEHSCAILGRMLGHSDGIKHIEEFEYPPMDARSDPHDLLVFSISLDNWSAAARRAVKAKDHERINEWNLDCVGKFGISNALFMDNLRPNAEFKRQGNQLHVYGDIDQGFAERFETALNENPSITEVTLGSGGGSIRDAIMAGIMIRERSLDTTIYGNCYSACPLVFLGGARRVVWAAPYRLGFHQIYTGTGDAVPFDSPIYTLVAEYVISMGADPSQVLPWMYVAGPNEMYEPEPDQLCQAIFATFVQRICGVDMEH